MNFEAGALHIGHTSGAEPSAIYPQTLQTNFFINTSKNIKQFNHLTFKNLFSIANHYYIVKIIYFQYDKLKNLNLIKKLLNYNQIVNYL